MDDFGKQFQKFYEDTKKALAPLPTLMAQESVNFFQDSFNRKAWIGDVTEPWKPRKNNKDAGRALLVKTARLKRSIRRLQANWNIIRVIDDAPYAAAHNEGVNEYQSIGSHSRIATRTVATKYLKNGKASTAKNSLKKVRGNGHVVKAHMRHMKIPKRQFMGNSQYLMRNLERIVLRELNKL